MSIVPAPNPHVNGAGSDDDFDEQDPEELTRIDDSIGWRERLLTSVIPLGDGKFKEVVQKSLSNAIAILRYHEDWRGVLAWDAFAERVITTRPPPWDPSATPQDHRAGPWRETDTGRVVDWLARNEKLAIKAGVVHEAVPIIAESNPMHPVRDYLRSLKWDGMKRLPSWLATYCGTDATEYASQVGMKWMISAVARPLEPGCQVDCMLILESKEQGTGKSSAFRALVPDTNFYSETGVIIGDKDSYQALHGVWIHLFDELDSLKRGEVTRAKNFITARKDHYRPSYGRVARDFLRQNVFAGSTNETEYFIDRTGNRRFWPVRVRYVIDVAAIIRDRDQLWAEAVARYDSGEKWYADTPELRRLFEAEQSSRVQPDALEPVVSRWLDDPKEYRVETNEFGKTVLVESDYDDSAGVLTVDVLLHALRKPMHQITTSDHMRAAAILKSLGYERGPQRREGHARVYRYVEVVNDSQQPEEPATLSPPPLPVTS